MLTLVLVVATISQPARLDAWRQFFVQVNVEANGEGHGGSGTVVRNANGKALVLTVRHVVDRPGEVSVIHLGKTYAAKRMLYCDDGDLATLEVAGLPAGAVRIAEGPTRRAWAFGFGPHPGRFHSHGGRYVGDSMRGLYSTTKRPDDEYRMVGESGDSGAGVINEAGHLCGVVWGGEDDLTSAVSLERVQDFLAAHSGPAPSKREPVSVETLLREIEAQRLAIARLEKRIDGLTRSMTLRSASAGQ